MDGPTVLVDFTAEAGEQVRVGHEARPNENGRARDHDSVDQFDALQAVLVNDESRDRAVGDADAVGGEPFALVGGEGGVGVWEQRDVGRPLPDQQRVMDGVRRAP